MMISPYLHIDRIEFMVTHRCTGRCLHCSVGDCLNQPGTPAHVPLAASVEAVRWLAQAGRMESLMTFGGEPLLFPEVTCALHQTAKECGIPRRQLITNGCFTRQEDRIREVARKLAESGVNDVLVSVDAFHQATLPIGMARCFAVAARNAGIERVRFQPAWVVNAEHDNPHNQRTRAILESLADTGIPVHSGNDIFLSGRAAEHLAGYYPPPSLDPEQRCGSMPYTEPLTDIRSLSISPDGSVCACAIPIGNILENTLEEIAAGYDPFAREETRAAMAGVPGLLALAEKRGISLDMTRCRSVCDLCRLVNGN